MNYILSFKVNGYLVKVKEIIEPVLTSFIRAYSRIADNNVVFVEPDNIDYK